MKHAVPALAASLALALPSLAASPSPAPSATDGGEPRGVAIVVYEGVELLDFAGPGEVFSAARDGGRRAFETFTVAATTEPITSQSFVEVRPSYSFDDCPATAIVVIPGGGVPLEDERLRAFVTARAASSVLVSVCNGALVLGSLGLLDGLEVTTHHGSLGALADVAPEATVLANRRFVDNGRIVTCAGVLAGIDGALHVVARLLGRVEAEHVARYMEYDWRPEELAALHARRGEVVRRVDAQAIVERVAQRGLEATAAWFRAQQEAPTEARLNAYGYAALRRGDTASAVAVLRLADRVFADSANAADSLSEALERAGRTEEALDVAERALARLRASASEDGERGARLANAIRSRLARGGRLDEPLLWACPPCDHACDAVRFVSGTSCPGCHMALEPIADSREDAVPAE